MPGLGPAFLFGGGLMLQERITRDMKDAMKAGDKARLSAIRMLRAAIKDKEIELGRAPDEAELVALISRLVKQRLDAARQYEEGGRTELAERERREAEVYRAYLPQPLGADELAGLVEAAIDETGAAGMRDMGKVMAALKPRVQGRADMGEVSALVKEKLAGR